MDATDDGTDDGSGLDRAAPWPEVNADDHPLTWAELNNFLEYLVRFVVHDLHGPETWRVEADDDVFVTFTTSPPPGVPEDSIRYLFDVFDRRRPDA